MRVLPWCLAAAFAFATATLGLRIASLRSENAALNTERELAEIASKVTQLQLTERTIVAEKLIADLRAELQGSEKLSRLEIVSLPPLLRNTADAKAIVVWAPGQQSGLITVENLPAVAAGQDYQIWVVDPQYPLPVDGGVFKPDTTGKAVLTFKTDKPVKQAVAFAVSLERKGGVQQAEGPMVLFGKH